MRFRATDCGRPAFAPGSYGFSKPLPTYLVAIGVGPFDVVETTVPPNAVRKAPLAFRIIATKGQRPRMQYAAAEAPKLRPPSRTDPTPCYSLRSCPLYPHHERT